MRAAAAVIALLLTSASASAGSGGWRLEPYHTSIRNGDADIAITSGGITETASVDSGANNNFGLRFAAWGSGPRVALAGGIDIAGLSTMEEYGPMVDATVSSWSFFVGARAASPLVGNPRNGLYPFVFAGLSFVNADGSMRTQTLQTNFDTSSGIGLSPSAPGDVAPYLSAGTEWDIASHLALVVDYRVQRYDVDADIFLSDDTASFSLDASAISTGLAWRVSAPGN